MTRKQPTTALGSTQKFTEIEDIIEDIVLLRGGYACLIIEVQANNFSLLSKDEQDARITAYASLLNSLSFPIQIVIRNKIVDVSSYLHLLDQETQRQTGSLTANSQLRLYRAFIEELIKVRTVLDKKFYIVIPYSPLETGGGQAAAAMLKQTKGVKQDAFISVKAALHTKADSLREQLVRLSLQTKRLDKENLVKLFFDIYNQSSLTEIQKEQPLFVQGRDR